MSATALVARAERQLKAVRVDLDGIEVAGGATDGSVLGEVAAGLATAMLTLRSLEEAVGRETSMEKRQEGKMYALYWC